MKYQHIIDALYHKPLAITTAGFETIDAIARPIIFENKRPETDAFGRPMDIKMVIESGVATIPIFGPLLQHASLLAKQCGATSYDDIREDLENAANARVDCAILNFNSPGGQATGCLECAEFIRDFQEETGIPVYAFTDTQMCSAAYFLASACDTIFATRTAMVGSIGVIIALMDSSKAMENEGLKPMIFSSGKFKATGAPGVAFTPEQIEYLESMVADGFAQFADFVSEQRPQVSMDSMQGQVFWGEQALTAGLVDDTVNTISDLGEFFELAE
jgi:signal peptide peptidase SppA